MIRKPFSLLLTGVVFLGASCTSLWNSSVTGPKFEHGSYRLGGAMGVSYTDDEFNGVDTNTLSLGLDLGRFYSENLELGVRGAYTEVEVGTATSDRQEYLLFGRWYVTPNMATRPWLELAAGGSSIDSGATDVSGFLYSVALGLTQFLNDRVAIEVGFKNSVGNYDAGVESDTVSVGVGLAVFW